MNQIETETIYHPLLETVKGFVVPAPSSQKMDGNTKNPSSELAGARLLWKYL